MIPELFLVPVHSLPGSPAGLERIVDMLRSLEMETDVCLRMIDLLAEQLQLSQGSLWAGTRLARILAACDADERENVATQIQDFIAQKKKGKAAGIIREFFGVTWDEAHAIMSNRGHYSKDQWLKWLKVVQLSRALDRELPQ
jgi:hypothetical protein